MNSESRAMLEIVATGLLFWILMLGACAYFSRQNHQERMHCIDQHGTWEYSGPLEGCAFYK